MKKLIHITTIICICFISKCYSQIQKGLDLNGEAAGDWAGVSVSMPDGLTVAVGASKNDDNGSNSGHARVFTWNGSAWIQKGNDLDGESIGDEHGTSVSMPDSNTIAVGSPGNDGNGIDAGRVCVYRWNGAAWIMKGLEINGEAAGDYSGYSISMPDSNTVAIGAFLNDDNGSNSGHVRVFIWNGTTWIQKGTDIIGEAMDDHFGVSVSMPNSNTIGIGGQQNDGGGTDSGHGRVYEWNGSSWIQKGLDMNGEGAGDKCGYSVSMPDNNTIALGSPLHTGSLTNSGQARIFQWNGVNWIQKGSSINGQASFDWLGFSVAMPDSNTIGIGINYDDNNGIDDGQTQVYQWNGSSWVQFGDSIDGEAPNDLCGSSVAMPNLWTIATGAIANDGNGLDAGHVRVYELCSPSSSILNISACNSYTSPSGNSTWTTSGTYNDVIPNVSGCDSVITINLMLSTPNAPTGSATQIFCNSALISDLSATGTAIQWYATASGGSPLAGATALVNGSMYYASQNVSGCESANRFAVNVVINTVSDITTSVSGILITAINSNASYTWLDCNNNFSIITGATVQTFTATTNGTYAVQLTENGCVDTSSCVTITTVGLESIHDNYVLSIFPNPINGAFTLDLGRTENEIIVSITDVNGRIISRENFKNKQIINLNLSSPSGFYYMTVITEDKQHVIKLIKN